MMSLTRKSKAAIALILLWIAADCRGQVTVGYGTGSQGGQVDLATTAYVFLNPEFGAGAAGLTVSSWSFYTGPFEGSRDITPLLWEFLEGSTFSLKAIGASVSVVGNTVYSNLPFDLQSGSDLITSNAFYFGWKDGTQTSPNAGVISFDYLGQGMQTAFALAGNSIENITNGQIDGLFNLGNQSLGERTYRFSATAIPEPATMGLTFAMMALVAVAWRRIGIRSV